ncbi:YhhN-domain-containing protein [Trichocladium antarcticum]|uniref:YhhN-domain-containing protein n=1 Tax=Trichocladium antarcticum TaxID=1450529 RepID=A0AAN6ZAG2_9PEZI|nr:YhhN-domain-containing protein [Trichocladium antarcticum]
MACQGQVFRPRHRGGYPINTPSPLKACWAFEFRDQKSSQHQIVTMSSSSAVLAASIGSAILYGTLVRSRPSRWRMVVKTASTAMLSAATAMRGGSLLLVGALALGATGDAFLAWDDEASFLRGLGSFLVAHILYIAAFVQHDSDGLNLEVLLSGWRAVAAGALALLAPAMIASLLPRIGRELRPPVVVYSLTIFVMALAALTLDSSQVITGAIMFTGSDSILAADRFLVSPTASYRPWMQHAVWVFYYVGQLLIAMGFLSLEVDAP